MLEFVCTHKHTIFTVIIDGVRSLCDLYLDRVFSSVVRCAARVVAGHGGQGVIVLRLSVEGREDVDVSLTQRRRSD